MRQRAWVLGVVCSIAWAPSLTAQPAPARIVVEVSNFRSDRGRVYCDLHNSAAAFPRQPQNAVARQWGPIAGRRAQCVFDGVAPGWYAVAVVHDENGNGRMDTGLFGIPTEPVVSSNMARGFMGPPSFADARFQFAGGTLVHRVHF